MKIENLRVNDLAESIVESGFPMLNSPMTEQEFEDAVVAVENDIIFREGNSSHIKRAKRLGKQTGGHDCFLKGIGVRYHITMPLTMLKQFERYNHAHIVSSMSTMHRITSMNLDECFTKSTDPEMIKILKKKVDKYNNTDDNSLKKELFESIVDSAPSGLELTMSVSSNYLQEKTIINQRKYHKLTPWRDYCDFMVKRLPMFKELTTMEINR